MTLGEWIEHVEFFRNKYIEGGVTAQEYFNAIVFYACGVESSEEKDSYKLPEGVNDGQQGT